MGRKRTHVAARNWQVGREEEKYGGEGDVYEGDLLVVRMVSL